MASSGFVEVGERHLFRTIPLGDDVFTTFAISVLGAPEFFNLGKFSSGKHLLSSLTLTITIELATDHGSLVCSKPRSLQSDEAFPCLVSARLRPPLKGFESKILSKKFSGSWLQVTTQDPVFTGQRNQP